MQLIFVNYLDQVVLVYRGDFNKQNKNINEKSKTNQSTW